MSETEFIFEPTSPPPVDYVLDEIIPRIKKWSEDIYEFEEKEYYKIRWVQLDRDTENPEVMLHLFFIDDFQYLNSLNGDIIFKGKWQVLSDSNALILHKMANKQITQSELYDLVFLNEDFFILKKHGNQQHKGKAKYLFLGNEESVEGLSWEEKLNLLDSHQTSMRTVIAIVLIAIITIALLAYQFY